MNVNDNEEMSMNEDNDNEDNNDINENDGDGESSDGSLQNPPCSNTSASTNSNSSSTNKRIGSGKMRPLSVRKKKRGEDDDIFNGDGINTWVAELNKRKSRQLEIMEKMQNGRQSKMRWSTSSPCSRGIRR